MYKNYIKFNVPFVAHNQLFYLKSLLNSKSFSGNNFFTKKCQNFLKKNFKYKQVLLTTSCTDALEMSAILANIKNGDEVIIPSYTFVSTANAFALRGAKIIFADSSDNNPNISIAHLTKLVNKNTKCVVVVHYAGFACDMKEIMYLKKKFNFFFSRGLCSFN
jgi:dTDP-4-amino-4,6-dideoxygalactose transaminase